MKKFAFALVCTFTVAGFVMADEFMAQISKVDGSKVTFKKGGAFGFGGGGKKGGKATEEQKEETLTAIGDVKVLKGEFDIGAIGGGFGKGTDKGAGKGKGTGKGGGFGGITYKAGDPIENGLKNEVFTKAGETAVNAQITTNDKNEITQILVIQGFGGKKGGTGKGGFGGTGKGGKKGFGTGM